MATTYELVPINTALEIDLSKASLTMQGLYDMVVMSYPRDPEIKIIGISLPIIGLNCKAFGLFYPDFDIKEGISKIFDYLMKSFIRPIWNVLYKLYEALKRFGLGFLDLKLPILNLTVSDLLAPNFYERLTEAITELYYKQKDKLLNLLEKLNIPNLSFDKVFNPVVEIGIIVKNIMSSLWNELLKIIGKVISLIKIGLTAFDIATYKVPTLSTLWNTAVNAVLGKILSYFITPFSLQDIYDMVIKFAKDLFGKAILTYEELLEALKRFKLPIFGNPFDWKLPIEISISAPNIDFIKILTDIGLWLNNFIWNLILQFIKLIGRILSVFGLSFQIPKIKIPITLCGVKTVAQPAT